MLNGESSLDDSDIADTLKLFSLETSCSGSEGDIESWESSHGVSEAEDDPKGDESRGSDTKGDDYEGDISYRNRPPRFSPCRLVEFGTM